MEIAKHKEFIPIEIFNSMDYAQIISKKNMEYQKNNKNKIINSVRFEEVSRDDKNVEVDFWFEYQNGTNPFIKYEDEEEIKK